MRTRALVTAVIVTALAACGGDDDGGAAEADELNATEAQAIVDDALLDVDDLGAGWELTNTEPPSDDDEDEGDNPFAECVGSDIDARIEGNELAESETREFSKEGDIAPSELSNFSGGTKEPALLGEMHEVIAGDAFERCLTDAIRDEVAGEDVEGLTLEFGAAEVDDALGDVDDGEVTHLHLPIAMTAEGVEITARIDFVFVSSGQLGSFLFAFGFGEAIADDDLARWTGILADRLAV